MAKDRILIVEDDLPVLMDLEHIVTEAVGADVALATTISEAEPWIGPDLTFALLDIEVTNSTTFDIADRLRAIGVGVAFVSGSDPEDLPADLRDVAFIQKPFRRQQVERVLVENAELQAKRMA